MRVVESVRFVNVAALSMLLLLASVPLPGLAAGPLEILSAVSAARRLGFDSQAGQILRDAGPDFREQVGPAVFDAVVSGLKGHEPDVLVCDGFSQVHALAAPLMFEKGRTMLAAGHGDQCIRRYLREYPGHVDTYLARLLLGEWLLAQGRNVEASIQARAVIAGRVGRSLKARALLLDARTMSAPSRDAAMLELFLDYPDTVAAESTGLVEEELSNDQLRRRAAGFFSAWDYVNYQSVLLRLWERGDRSPELACRIARSRIIHVRDDPADALQKLLHARGLGVCMDPEGTFLLGRIHARLEDYDSALSCFSDYIASGAKKNRMLAHYYLAWLPYDHQEYERALPAMERFLKKYRKSDRYSYMIWFKGWSLFRMGRYREAIGVFASMKRLGNSLVAGKAMYWGGMAHHRLGNRSSAKKWFLEVIDRYPLTWYSVLAAKRMKEFYGSPFPGWMTGPAAVAGEPRSMPDPGRIGATASAAAGAARVLHAIGRPREAFDVWRPHQSSWRRLTGVSRAEFMISMAEATGQYNRLLKDAGKAFGSSIGRVPTPSTGMYWAARYPKAFRPLVSRAAEAFGIPELWVYSIMRQESRYDTGQVSHTAALGVMQMIAATARIVGDRVGVRWEPDTFFEPGRNILFGTRYLADLLEDFKGQIVFASAAYNSGAPAIRRFMLANRGLPLDEMVEMIPYNEGRNYCRKVAEHLVRYGVIYLGPQEREQLMSAVFPDTVDYEIGASVTY